MIQDYAHAASLQERHERAGWDAHDAREAAIDDMPSAATPYRALVAVVRAVLPHEVDGFVQHLTDSSELWTLACDCNRPDDMTAAELAHEYVTQPWPATDALEWLRKQVAA